MSNYSPLHRDDWILRRIYDIQRELVQVRLTAYEVRGDFPALAKLCDDRYDQLQGQFAKYNHIYKQKNT